MAVDATIAALALSPRRLLRSEFDSARAVALGTRRLLVLGLACTRAPAAFSAWASLELVLVHLQLVLLSEQQPAGLVKDLLHLVIEPVLHHTQSPHQLLKLSKFSYHKTSQLIQQPN
jgi:hypothetical protein